MPPIVQLSFELQEPASDRLEQLLAEEMAREAAAPRVPPPPHRARGRTGCCSYTPHLIAQTSRVAELLDAGHTQNQIGQALGVSGLRVAEIKRQLPELRPYLGDPAPLDRLRGHRDQFWLLRRQTLQLAATIRDDLRELDEELEAAQFDRMLGLRAGWTRAGSPSGGSALRCLQRATRASGPRDAL